MNGRLNNWLSIAILAMTVVLASCTSTGVKDWLELRPESPGTGPDFLIVGTVRHLDLEGGLFVIRDTEGTQYNPLNLPEAFQVDGLPVEAYARRRDDVASIGMIGPHIELLRIRKQPGDESRPAELWGTTWRLEDLAGAGVVDRTQATLEFATQGKASGIGSCNRFNGTVTIEGSAIKFGSLATTRMACIEAVMKQEEAYLAALREAGRFEIHEQFLYIHTAGHPKPLRFVAAPAAPGSPAPSHKLSGIWTIVRHHAPGISALTDADARARYGRTVRLTESEAVSDGNHCAEPTYATRTVPREEFLAAEFKLPQGSLAPLASREQINLLEVRCGDARWAAMGGLLFEIDANRALAPWDGVFFELARDRDFRAIGQEPGWQLEILKGLEIRFTYDYGAGKAVTPAPTPEVDPDSGTRTYHAVTEASDLHVAIEPTACTDTMSGQPFAETVTVMLGGRTFHGCGE